MKDIETICYEISDETGIHPATVRTCARRIFRAIRETLAQQEEVEIENFGQFVFKQRKAKISANVSGGPATYTPANSKISFRSDKHWEYQQRINSSQIPDQLPEGTVLGNRLSKSHRVRSEFPHLAAVNDNPFYQNVIIPKAIKKHNNEQENV